MMRVAVLLTCFNRRAKTLACLEHLQNCHWPRATVFEVWLVDDSSTDGTVAAVQAAYPAVRILPGDGNLFWNGGMRKAFLAALAEHFDYYLWLNDDTMLFPDAPARLFAAQAAMAACAGQHGIAAGNTCDAVTGEHTYGGLARRSWIRALSFPRVEPRKEPQPCDTMNGNCVLIHHRVAEVIGVNDGAFIHGQGDVDYGLRARQAGFPVWMAGGYVGECSNNPTKASYRDRQQPLAMRWRKITGPKGLPLRSWFVLTSRHGGWLWPLHFIWPYLRLVLEHLPVLGTAWNARRQGERR